MQIIVQYPRSKLLHEKRAALLLQQHVKVVAQFGDEVRQRLLRSHLFGKLPAILTIHIGQ